MNLPVWIVNLTPFIFIKLTKVALYRKSTNASIYDHTKNTTTNFLMQAAVMYDSLNPAFQNIS